MGVAVGLDPQLEPGTDVVVGLGLELGRLHPAVQDAADHGGDEHRDAHHDEDADQAEAAVRVVVVIQRLAVLGVEVQCAGAEVDVGLGSVGVVAVRQQGHDLVFQLLNAVVGKGGDAPAVGDGDVLAGAEGDHEQDAAFSAAGAKVVLHIIVLGVGALVGVADAVHREEIDVAVMPGGSVLGAGFQLGKGVGVEQAVLIPHKGRVGQCRAGETDRKDQGGKECAEAAQAMGVRIHSAHLLISRAAR